MSDPQVILKAGSHLFQCSSHEVCISFSRDVLQSRTDSGPVLALMSNTCLPAIACPTRRLLQPGRGQTTVTLEGPLVPSSEDLPFCSYPFFCAWFQPLWICASLLNVDSWVLASWPQLCPSLKLLPTAQLGPLDVMF